MLECEVLRLWVRKQAAVKSLGKPRGRKHDSMNLLGGHARGQKPVKTAGTASVLVSSFSMFLIMFWLTSHWPGFSLRDRIRFGVRTLHFSRTSSLSRSLVMLRLRRPLKSLSLCSKFTAVQEATSSIIALPVKAAINNTIRVVPPKNKELSGTVGDPLQY